MKEWWTNLALREKQIVFFGGIFCFLLFFYILIWLPFTNHISNLRHKIQQNHKLLTWMQEASQQIFKLEKNSTHEKISATSILSLLQNEISKSPFAKHITKLRQADSSSVQFSLQKIDFDALITWLILLSKNDGLIVAVISLTPADKAGLVSGEITLRSD